MKALREERHDEVAGRRRRLAAVVTAWAVALGAAALSFAAAPVAAAEPAPEAALPHYLFPDLAPGTLTYEGRYFTIKPIFAIVEDYTFFEQDATSVAKSGKQQDTGELRAGRIAASFLAKGSYKWDFYFSTDYQEKKTREGAVLQLYDLKIGLPLGPVKLDIGKMKEPFVYELTGLSVLLPQQERILLPFYPTRSIGVRLSGPLAGHRMTWAAGAYNDFLDTGTGLGRTGNDYVGRLTALAWESRSKRDYLHLGLGLRRQGSDDGVMRFSGRPESNVASKYLDTGNFTADHADEVSLELLINHGPCSLLAERIDTKVDSFATGDPRFSGYYAAGSWILTGEGRHYVRAGGYASGVMPKSRYGALELVLKYSHLDLTDGTLDGGLLDKWHFGLNWWASAEWKVGVSYGDALLDKAGLRGRTKMLLLRLQWVYG